MDFSHEEILISPTNAWPVADKVLPGEAVVVHSYLPTGTLPSTGFSFVDEYGTRRYFTFVENMGYPYDPGPYRWLIREFDWTTGELGVLMGY
jgi:hypothetical protein